MATKGKRFRIEETMLEAMPESIPAAGADLDARFGEIMSEIRALRAMVASAGETRGLPNVAQEALQQQIAEARKLQMEFTVIDRAIKRSKAESEQAEDQSLDGGQLARATQELAAVCAGTSEATDRILKSAEDIEQIAATLIATVKNEHEKSLVHDIQDHVTQIFEACNFHDLTGQRISKALSALKLIEDHIAQMIGIWSAIERFTNHVARLSNVPQTDALLNGPKLEGDEGHSSQTDIDALFH
ncbi:MAG: protein phosphatase CheZ [Pseudorhodoplanes sp.]